MTLRKLSAVSCISTPLEHLVTFARQCKPLETFLAASCVGTSLDQLVMTASHEKSSALVRANVDYTVADCNLDGL